jgi:hypothetical protein
VGGCRGWVGNASALVPWPCRASVLVQHCAAWCSWGWRAVPHACLFDAACALCPPVCLFKLQVVEWLPVDPQKVYWQPDAAVKDCLWAAAEGKNAWAILTTRIKGGGLHPTRVSACLCACLPVGISLLPASGRACARAPLALPALLHTSMTNCPKS